MSLEELLNHRWLSQTLRSLKQRNFRLFFIGQSISLIGTWMQMVAVSWLVYKITKSSAALGLVNFSQNLPIFFLTLLGGVAADRFPKKNILIWTQLLAMIQAFSLTILVFTDTIQVWHLYLLALVLGIISAFEIPARQSFFIDLVPNHDLSNAIALNASIFNSARIIGPSIAGFIVSQSSEGWCFLINALSYIIVIGYLILIKPSNSVIKYNHNSPIQDILEGITYAMKTPSIKTIFLTLLFVSLFGVPYFTLMPVFAAEILHGGSQMLGLLLTCSGIGAFLGSILFASLTQFDPKKLTLYTMIPFSISLIIFSMSTSLPLSLFSLVVLNFSLMVFLNTCNTTLQHVVPNHLRGRIMSIYTNIFMGSFPFGSLVFGISAHYVGAPRTVLCGALISLFFFISTRYYHRDVSFEIVNATR